MPKVPSSGRDGVGALFGEGWVVTVDNGASDINRRYTGQVRAAGHPQPSTIFPNRARDTGSRDRWLRAAIGAHEASVAILASETMKQPTAYSEAAAYATRSELLFRLLTELPAAGIDLGTAPQQLQLISGSLEPDAQSTRPPDEKPEPAQP